MPSRVGSAVAVVLATLVVLSLAGGVAVAHTTSFGSSSSIGYDDGAFEGVVTSSKAACMRKRLVKLFRQDEPGRTLLGSDRTNGSGAWRVPFGLSAATKYYAKVTRHDLSGAARHNHVCRAARSATFQVLP